MVNLFANLIKMRKHGAGNLFPSWFPCLFNKMPAAQWFVNIRFAKHYLSFLFNDPVGILCQVPANGTNGVNLGNIFGHGQQGRHGTKRPAKVIHVEAGNDHPDPAIGQGVAHRRQLIIEKLGFINADHIKIIGHQQNLARRMNGGALNGIGIVRNNIPGMIALVDHRLVDLKLLLRNAGTLHPPNELFGLARKHGAANYFDPTAAIGIFRFF